MPGDQFSLQDFAEAKQTLTGWLNEGKLQDTHTFVDGFERAPEAVMGLFSGLNIGKMLVRVPKIEMHKSRL
jgi:NADPH-dependent curcumin reductase CurA